MIWDMVDSPEIQGVVPVHIKDPESYYKGVDSPSRVFCRNVILYERLSRKALQQQNLANRMHHRYVLIRVLETSGVVSVDGQSLQLNEGDVLLVTPYQFHHFIDLESDELRWLFITFELEQGESILSGLSYRCLQLDQVARDLWSEITTLWECENSAQQVELMPILDRMLTRLQFQMDAQLIGASAPLTGSGNEWVAKIEALIIRSVREGWTFEEVAKRAGFSARHLRNRFEQQMGLSLREYRSNYQFHTALSLMIDTNRSLSDVAELSGFHSQSVFTRFIRRMANRSPRELCRQIRADRKLKDKSDVH